MKKWLGLGILAVVFLLSACGSSVVVCTDVNGNTARAYYENDEITSIVLTETEDISDLDEEALAFFVALMEEMPEVDEFSVEDGISTMTMTIEADGVLAIMGALDIDQFVAHQEAQGLTCE
ncbi:MAG: hypothetical protein FWE07_05905 [Turicibacter sp.]|nr:hypothetical protein [Turicibacter sp.]